MGSFSVWHWLIVLVIVVLVFGTGKLKNMGKDLGGAIKGFKEGMKEGDDDKAPQAKEQLAQSKDTVDVEAKEKAKAEKEMAMFANQLNNPKFVERAPAALVEDIRNKYAKSQDKLANIEQSIKALG